MGGERIELLGERELKYFEWLSRMDKRTRERVLDEYVNGCMAVEMSTCTRFPTMMAGICVLKDVYDNFRKWSGSEGNLAVLSSPEYSSMAILLTHRRQHDYRIVTFQNFLKIKRERYDVEFKKVKSAVSSGSWNRVGRRPKYKHMEELTVGFFGAFFPFSRREVFLIFQLPTIKMLFNVTSTFSYTKVSHVIERVRTILVEDGLLEV